MIVYRPSSIKPEAVKVSKAAVNNVPAGVISSNRIYRHVEKLDGFIEVAH
jgi:hypothetical protein